tara:strand:+ start:1381 stop:2004 length:624 start_codon:yes stop_codon:yes gene_type:complete
LNNIDLIDYFLISENDNHLIINQVSEEICIFYKFIIFELCEKKRINVVHSDGEDLKETKDLFKEQELKLCASNNSKAIEKVLSKKDKCILITDYRAYKKYSKKTSSVNGYNYDKDIKYYLQNKLSISDLNLLEFCISAPHLAFSEISKFLVNSNGYVREAKIKEKNNTILELRKELYNLKNKGGDLKNIYENLRNEAKYKKFNFLTF